MRDYQKNKGFRETHQRAIRNLFDAGSSRSFGSQQCHELIDIAQHSNLDESFVQELIDDFEGEFSLKYVAIPDQDDQSNEWYTADAGNGLYYAWPATNDGHNYRAIGWALELGVDTFPPRREPANMTEIELAEAIQENYNQHIITFF